MQLNIFKRMPLEQLVAEIPNNIEKYTDENIWIDDYFSSKSMDNYYQTTGLLVPDFDLKTGGAETDADNAQAMYEALKDTLNPRLASDIRLWAYLAHKTFYPYMVKRWPIQIPDVTDETDKDASKKQKILDRVKSRYFFGASNGKAFVRQGIARLYWSAALTYDESNSDPYEMTRYLLDKDQDRFVAATERTLARNKTFLLAALKVLKTSGKINRTDTRAYFSEVNRACGTEILDALSPSNAQDLCEKCLDYVMSLPSVKKGSTIKAKEIDSGKIILLNAAPKGVYLGKSLLDTVPKSIIGMKPGNRFSYGKHKTRIKVVGVDN